MGARGKERGDNRDFNVLFENNGDGSFSDMSDASGILKPGKRIHRAAIFGDYDNDGFIDFYVVNNGEESYEEESDRHGVLFRNDSTSNGNWLKIRLTGTTSNKDAFGTKISLTTDDKTQIREHVSGDGYFSTNAQEVHFGLGDAETIDSLFITWPSGRTQALDNVKVNQTLELAEPPAKRAQTNP